MRSLGVLIIAAYALGSIASQLALKPDVPRTVVGLLTETDPPPGFEYAMQPRKFDFPADHAGNHTREPVGVGNFRYSDRLHRRG